MSSRGVAKAPTRFVVVAGNIGVGKTSFVERYARATGAKPALEPVAENPYLADFYKDMPRWGFSSQVFFLSQRIRQHLDLQASPQAVVQDRSLYEDAEIFARNLFDQGALSARDWQTYGDLYAAVSAALQPPDLVIYLRATVKTLQSRIALRGRDYERSLSPDYLNQLNARYDAWARSFQGARVLTLDTDGTDFVARPTDFDSLMDAVARNLLRP